MDFSVVLTNNSSNVLWIRILKDNEYKYICVVDEICIDDKVLFETDDYIEAERYAETHYL